MIQELIQKAEKEEQARTSGLQAELDSIDADFELIDSQIGAPQTSPAHIIDPNAPPQEAQKGVAKLTNPIKVMVVGILSSFLLALEAIKLTIPVIRKIMRLFKIVTKKDFEERIDDFLAGVEWCIEQLKKYIPA